jgi:hypothetical protein
LHPTPPTINTVVDPAADVKGGTRSDLLWTCVSHSSLGDLHEHGEDRLLERVAEVGRGRHTCGNELIVFLREEEEKRIDERSQEKRVRFREAPFRSW